jgi:undecaprenyl-diphosphatase
LSCIGSFNHLSAEAAKFLFESLGYTNKWSNTYGEPWFVNMNSNFSAFGSREIVFVFLFFYSVYLFRTKEKQKTFYFLFTMIGAIILILATKYLTANEELITWKMIVTESISEFPSGHTFIATVLYLATAVSLKSKTQTNNNNRYFLIIAVTISIIVGISRIAGAAHTVTDVVAGWSLGVCWVALVQIIWQLEEYFSKSKNKLRKA